MEDNAQQLAPWFQLATSTGFVGLAWYLIAVWIPREREESRKDVEVQREEFCKTLEKQCDTFDKLMAAERTHFREVLSHITREFTGELRRIHNERDSNQV